MKILDEVKGLFDYIENSPSCFHAIQTTKNNLLAGGYTELSEGKTWKLAAGGKYFVTRNLSSVIAFSLPESNFRSFHIIASHSDSPTFKIKENAELEVKDKYIQLNTERYGGMLCASWLDRPLSVAGRVLVSGENGVETRLVNIDKDFVIIPNLAIHMNREANDGYKYNAQEDMLPLYGSHSSKGSFKKAIADNCGAKEEEILGSDLFLYNRMKPTVWGAEDEFISSPKLDDLECAFSSLQALLKCHVSQSVAVCCILDNEEVGSTTKQGADSTFLSDVLRRINLSMGKTEEDYYTALASSFMLSADNAHAVHPNHTGKADPTNQPFMNSGVVIKYNANQKYTTDAVSSAVFQNLCKGVDVPCQSFANRSDLVGGSTLGNISNTHVSLNTVDIGLAQLAMHSSYETAGAKDVSYMITAMETFYNASLEAVSDGKYLIHK